MADISMQKIVKRFGDTETIHGVDLKIEHREFVVFVGPSGCGKTTLLRLIAGLEDISAGDLYIGGERVNDMDSAARGIAMVFQSYALYPHMTVAQNMGFGLRMARVPKKEVRAQVEKAARILQLEDYLDRKPKQLSGGQRQRVAIGRAIVRQPQVFLFDEPLSNLDAELRVEMRVQLQELHRKLDTTMIYVTHDQVEAMTMADKIVVLRDGQVQQVGSPLEIYERPCNAFVAGFIGSPRMNFLAARVVGVEHGRIDLELTDAKTPIQIARESAAGVEPGAHVTLGIRPEHLREGDDGDAVLSVPVQVTERLGNVAYLYGEYGDLDRFVVQADAYTEARNGDTATVTFAARDCHLFDRDGAAI
ncbi:sn-glycerol-3-phosphate ABC transporter ATP-binding protein UgpC [Salinisphaera sp.]|uniref:ABC transporter ATP-binding protein n=1 Tax=Salinisphaera sp. TaxID=1914330 RepID=UPI002D76C05B|nr:sn-glycerol-3-phosphate ABC transporter ATP-binding protein UgpC [Salinisphaera sp.]HET7313555.1 sn-glycerol-3-phosphate ABC transporter ATP-binding protein UgpC [Salinisphaera sp.]